jgi:hypothetical protein
MIYSAHKGITLGPIEYVREQVRTADVQFVVPAIVSALVVFWLLLLTISINLTQHPFTFPSNFGGLIHKTTKSNSTTVSAAAAPGDVSDTASTDSHLANSNAGTTDAQHEAVQQTMAGSELYKSGMTTGMSMPLGSMNGGLGSDDMSSIQPGGQPVAVTSPDSDVPATATDTSSGVPGLPGSDGIGADTGSGSNLGNSNTGMAPTGPADPASLPQCICEVTTPIPDTVPTVPPVVAPTVTVPDTTIPTVVSGSTVPLPVAMPPIPVVPQVLHTPLTAL